MQWVETTGRTVEDAKSAALDQLGVAEDDAEFEILEEPRPGLFGRIRGEARVRARVRPTQPRPKVDRRSTRRRGGRGDGGERSSPGDAPAPTEPTSAEATTAPVAEALSAADQTDDRTDERGGAPKRSRRRSSKEQTMGGTEHEKPAAAAPTREQVAQEAERFMTGLVAAFGLHGEVRCAAEGDELEVTVEGDDLGLLIGPRGTTLLAIQDVARVASQRRLGDHETRLRVDVGGYRQRRREALARFAQQVADDVVATGVTRVLEPMPSADRKVVHDALAGRAGIETRSDGEEPNRRVVIARRVEHLED